MEKELQVAEELAFAQGFLREVREDIKSITRNFFTVGFRLNEANEFGYYKTLNYETIEDLAEAEFGFGRSTTYNLINVFRRFCDSSWEGTSFVRKKWIKPEFEGFSYSQLLSMSKFTYIPMPIANFVPKCAHVRPLKKYVKYVNSTFSNDHMTFDEWHQTEYLPSIESKKDNPLNSQAVQTSGQLDGQVALEEVKTDSPTVETLAVQSPISALIEPATPKNDHEAEFYTVGRSKKELVVSEGFLRQTIFSFMKSLDYKVFFDPDNVNHGVNVVLDFFSEQLAKEIYEKLYE